MAAVDDVRAATATASSGDAWLLVGGQSVAVAGDSVLLIVLPLLVLDRTGSVLQVSLVFILTQLPTFLGFLAGTARRRVGSRALIVTYDGARLLLLLAMAGLTALRPDLIAVVYVLYFAVNVCATLFRPTRIDLITRIVPQGALLKFNSYDRMLEALATAIGLGLGGYAYRYLPVPGIFLATSLTFLVSGASVLFLRAPAARGGADASAPAPSFLGTLGSLARNRVPAFLIGGEAVAGLAFGAFLSMFVVYARRYLGVDSVTLGHFEMLQGLFATAAGLCLAANVLRLSDRSLAVLGYAGMGAAAVLLGVNSAVWPVYPLMVAFGFSNMLYAVAVRTLLQVHCRREQLIHVFALESMLSRASLIAGSAAAGGLLTLAVVGVGGLVLASGAVFVAVAAWGAVVLFALGRRLTGVEAL